MEKVEHCIYVAEATKYRPAGYKVIKFVTDQYGDRRCVQKVFRGRDALARAQRFRDDVESDKRNQRYYRDPARKVDKVKAVEDRISKGDLMALFELGPLTAPTESQRDEVPSPTLKDFMELGLVTDIEGNLTIDPKSTERGYLRRILEETGHNNQNQKLGIWSIIQDWGQIHELQIEDIKGTHIDDFVRYMEGGTSKNGKPYATATIRRYRMEMMSMVKALAAHVGVVNPLDQSPPNKKPSRIQGEEETVKVPTTEELQELEKGLQDRLLNTKARYHGQRVWAWHVHQVLRSTGCRPGEIFALTEKAIDRKTLTLTISQAVSGGEVGLTKTGKSKGSRSAGTRLVPITAQTLAVIDSWIAKRTDLKFKRSELIFAQQDGTPADDDYLRKHYKATGSSLTPYQMRHWRNDSLRRAGVPKEVRKAVLGHLSDEMNDNYTHVNPEELRRYLTGD